MRRLIVVLSATGVAAAALAGCGSDGAEKSGAKKSERTTSSTRPATTITEGIGVQVFFVRDERVAAVTRQVAAQGGPAEDALRVLLTGPTTDEEKAGYRSNIPSGTRLLAFSVAAGTATVDLSGEFASGGGSLSMQTRVAQIVFTATQDPAVRGVSFELDGKPITVLGGEGLLLEKPQTRADFADFAPVPATG